MKRLQFYIDEELDERLAVAAVKDGSSKAEIIRQAVSARLGAPGPGTDGLDSLVGAYPLEAGDIDQTVYST